MRKLCLFALCFAFLPSISEAQEAPDALPELVRRVEGAVVSIHVYDAKGFKKGQASGFILPDGRIVTNAHALAEGARVEVVSAADELIGTATYAISLSSRVDVGILPAMGSTTVAAPTRPPMF